MESSEVGEVQTAPGVNRGALAESFPSAPEEQFEASERPRTSAHLSAAARSSVQADDGGESGASMHGGPSVSGSEGSQTRKSKYAGSFDGIEIPKITEDMSPAENTTFV